MYFVARGTKMHSYAYWDFYDEEENHSSEYILK